MEHEARRDLSLGSEDSQTYDVERREAADDVFGHRMSEDDLSASQQELLDIVLEESAAGHSARFSSKFIECRLFGKTVRFPTLVLLLALFVLVLVVAVSAMVIALSVRSGVSTPGGDTGVPSDSAFNPTVLMISLDGFRADYFSKYPGSAQTLLMLRKEGVSVDHMYSVFPSKTFPNHYTIATGLYPESHGIVANRMYDPVFDEYFHLQSKDPKWWGGQPIWVTAELQGQKAGTVFWPGSDVNISGVLPSYYLHYDGSMTYSDRVDKVLSYLDKPIDQRPTLLTLYMEGIDHAGHLYGPDAPQISEAIQEVDTALQYLLGECRDRGYLDKINIVITSDHGMTSIDNSHVVKLESTTVDLLSEANVVTTTPILAVFPGDESSKEALFAALANNTGNFSVYRKENIPARYHYRNNRRIAPILGVADLGYNIVKDNRYNFEGGNHGYDNHLTEMQAIFVATGPAFKESFSAEPFDNIHVYELVAHVLGLDPAPNNGSLAVVSHMFA